MCELTGRILEMLDKKEQRDTFELAAELGEDHKKVVTTVRNLQCLGNIIECEQLTRSTRELTSEGKLFIERGSYEAIVFAAVPSGDQGISQQELAKVIGAAVKVGVSKAIKHGWIKLIKEEKNVKFVRLVEDIVDKVRMSLISIEDGNIATVPADVLTDLKTRKLLRTVTVAYYKVMKGHNFTTHVDKLETELTHLVVADQGINTIKCKGHDLQGIEESNISGRLHPLMNLKYELRSILLEVGFTELPPKGFVPSSFWDVSGPQNKPDQNYEFEHNANSSRDKHEIRKNIHISKTRESSLLLYENNFARNLQPGKFFSIERIPQNEILDLTPFAEIHYVQVVVTDYNLSLGNMKGLAKEVLGKLSLTKMRLKPFRNPNMKLSLEVFLYHEGLKKWIAVGHCGMIFPHIMLPIEGSTETRSITWRLSVERIAMIRYEISDIRKFIGSKVNLQMISDIQH